MDSKSLQTSSSDIKKIVDSVTVIYNDKIKEEKKQEGTKVKAKANKPSIKTGKAVEGYSRNNNPAMVNDLL